MMPSLAGKSLDIPNNIGAEISTHSGRDRETMVMLALRCPAHDRGM